MYCRNVDVRWKSGELSQVLIGSDLAYDVDVMPSLARMLAMLLTPRGEEAVEAVTRKLEVQLTTKTLQTSSECYRQVMISI